MAKKENNNENKIKKHFFKDFKAELKKVIWPTPKQLVNNTVAVVTIVLLTAVIVFALDAVFDLGNKYGITKLQSIVDEKFNSEENEEEHDHEHNHEEESSSEGTETTDENTTTEGESTEENTTTEENNTTEGDTTTETPVENAAQ